jgi:hypothetical protein
MRRQYSSYPAARQYVLRRKRLRQSRHNTLLLEKEVVYLRKIGSLAANFS